MERKSETKRCRVVEGQRENMEGEIEIDKSADDRQIKKGRGRWKIKIEAEREREIQRK